MTGKNYAKEFQQQRSTLLDEDYNIAKNKLDWSRVPPNILDQDGKLILKSLEGTSGELLAPAADIEANFADDNQAIQIAQAFIRILELRNADQLSYILALLCALLQSDTRRGAIFLSLNDSNLIQSFSRVWVRNDVSNYCAGKAAICASIILSSGTDTHGNDYSSLCSWMLREFKNKNDKLLSPLYALKGIIKNIHFQHLFCDNRGVQRLSDVLSECPDHRQVIYLTVYSLWALSFNKELKTRDGLLNGPLIAQLCDLVKNAVHIKITRVVMALFENLCGFGGFNEMVVLYEFFPELHKLKDQESKIDDIELHASVGRLIENLEHSVRTLSSFESYCVQIDAQKLIKGPCHTTKFWKRYSKNLEEDNYRLVRELVTLLDSNDIDTVRWACYDLGQWARFYPDAKSVIEKLNAKYKLMSLIEREEPIRSNALNAVQNILVKNFSPNDEDQRSSRNNNT